MIQVINTLTDLDTVTVPQGFTKKICDFEEYISGDLSNSIMIKIPEQSKDQIIHITADFNSEEFTDLAFNGCSFKCPLMNLQHAGEAHYSVDFGNEEIEIPLGIDFDTITVPFRRVTKFDIKVLTDEEDVIVISNLRAVKELMPQDILEGFRIMELPTVGVGTLSVKEGDPQIIVSTNDNIMEDSVISFNGEKHQIEKIDGHKITLASTFDGDKVLADFNGGFNLECPITIGYYDQDAKLPSVVLWFSSPTPVLRATKKEQYRVFGNMAYIKESMQLMSWTVKIDVVGGTPEMTQFIASYVRRFLEKNRIWINGKRFTFEWTDSAVDTEPSTYLDIQSSVVYNINIEIKEEFLWQTLNKGSPKLQHVLPMQEI